MDSYIFLLEQSHWATLDMSSTTQGLKQQHCPLKLNTNKSTYYPIFLIYVYYVLSLLFLFVGGVNNSGPVHMWLDVYNDGTIVCYGPANGRSLQVVCWAFLPWGPPFASTSLPPPMTPPPIITYLNKTIISPFKCTMSTASRTPPPYPPQAITKPVSQARATTESQGLYTQITWTLYYTDFSIIFRRNPCTILQRKEWLHWHLLLAFLVKHGLKKPLLWHKS